MIFGIMFGIAIIEFYVLKARQAALPGIQNYQIGNVGGHELLSALQQGHPCDRLPTKKKRLECYKGGRGGKPCRTGNCPEYTVKQ